MSPSLLRPLLATGLALGAALAGTGTAHACYGTQKTITVCTANVVVYSDCVYLGTGPCKPVSVDGPVCVYGTVGENSQYYTSTC